MYYGKTNNYALESMKANGMQQLLQAIENDELTCRGSASAFIDKLDSQGHLMCTELITRVFRADNYKYAKQVLEAVLGSDIDFIDTWFKLLLTEAKEVPTVSDYANQLWDDLSESFSNL